MISTLRLLSLILIALALTACPGDPTGPTVNQSISGTGNTGVVAIGGSGEDADADDATVITPAPLVVPPVVIQPVTP